MAKAKSAVQVARVEFNAFAKSVFFHLVEERFRFREQKLNAVRKAEIKNDDGKQNDYSEYSNCIDIHVRHRRRYNRKERNHAT